MLRLFPIYLVTFVCVFNQLQAILTTTSRWMLVVLLDAQLIISQLVMVARVDSTPGHVRKISGLNGI